MKNPFESPSAYVAAGMWRGLGDTIREIGFARLGAWVARNSVMPYSSGGRWCLYKLVNPRHKCNTMKCYAADRFTVLDHREFWRTGDGSFILTAHPYGLHGLKDLRAWCASQGLDVATDANGSWYYPGSTALVIVRGMVR